MRTENLRTESYDAYEFVTGNKSGVSKSSFSDIMDIAKNQQASPKKKVETDKAQKETTSESVTKPDESEEMEENGRLKEKDEVTEAEKEQDFETKTEQVQSTENASSGNDLTKEQQENTAENILNMQLLLQLSDALQISVEELAQGMDKLNLSMEDLVNPQNLIKMIVDLKQLNGPQDVLTNSELMDVFREFSAKFQEAMKNGELMQTEPVLDVVNKEEFITEDADTAEPVKMTENEMLKETVTIQNQTESSMFDGNESNSESAGENTEQSSVENITAASKMSGVQNMAEVLENVQKLVSEKVDVQTSETIMKQVTEQIRVHMGADVTSMEMQLYPEHLGKISIQLVSKNGAITAQIAAETETAKVALESQIATLKENFEQQGLKVESVEVMVSARGFDQREAKEQDSDNQNKQSKKNHKISLMDTEIVEEVNEDTTELKQAMGSTVSFQA